MRQWEEQEINQLRGLYAIGLSAFDIAQWFNRSETEIRQMAKAMGWIKPINSISVPLKELQPFRDNE